MATELELEQELKDAYEDRRTVSRLISASFVAMIVILLVVFIFRLNLSEATESIGGRLLVIGVIAGILFLSYYLTGFLIK